MKRSKKTKSYGLRVHTKRRLFQRYGITANNHSLKDIVSRIQNGEGKLVVRISNARSVYSLKIENKECFLVYDRNRHEIVTALPPDSREASIIHMYGGKDDSNIRIVSGAIREDG